MSTTSTLAAERLHKLRAGLEGSGFDAVLALSPANVAYASGYRSVSAAVHGVSAVAALVTQHDLVLVGHVADSAPAFDFGIPETDYVAYGRFFFEAQDGQGMATSLVDQNPGYAEAITAAVRRLNLGSSRIGIDDRAAPAELRALLAGFNTGTTFLDASAWLLATRSQKLPGEVAALETVARVTETGILSAIAQAGVGVTERELAGIVGRTLVEAGGEPKFIVVTTGSRSALADTQATNKAIQAGDLLRFDVGCVLDGYWSDIGRTAVIGEPTARQASFYAAMLAGEDAQLATARPGVSASALFDTAVNTVQSTGGPQPYRRQHCGHGIGLDVYEPPIIQPGVDALLEEGMVFCFETPYYELGWGGMMVEDTVVVTQDGIRMLTDRGRGLTVVPV